MPFTRASHPLLPLELRPPLHLSRPRVSHSSAQHQPRRIAHDGACLIRQIRPALAERVGSTAKPRYATRRETSCLNVRWMVVLPCTCLAPPELESPLACTFSSEVNWCESNSEKVGVDCAGRAIEELRATCERLQEALKVLLSVNLLIQRPAKSQTKTPCGGHCSIRISISLSQYTFLKKGDGGANTPVSGKVAAPFLRDPQFLATRTPGPVLLWPLSPL